MSLNDKIFNSYYTRGSINDKMYNAPSLSFIENATIASPISTITLDGYFSPNLILSADSLVNGKNMIYVEAYLKKVGAVGGWVPYLELGVVDSNEPIKINNWTLSATNNLCFRLGTTFTIKDSVVTGGYLAPNNSAVNAIVDWEGGAAIDVQQAMNLRFGVSGLSVGDSCSLISYSVFVNTGY